MEYLLAYIASEISPCNIPAAAVYMVDFAIGVAIKAKSISILQVLTKFCRTHGWAVGGVGPRRYIDTCIKNAILTGCVALCRAVPVTLSILMETSGQHWVKLLFDLACENGQAEIMKDMLTSKMESTNIERQVPVVPSPVQRGLFIAAKSGHAEVIRVQLRHGANIKLDAPVKAAIQGGRVGTIKYMLQRGAQISLKVLSELNDDLIQMDYKGPRSFSSEYQVLSYYIAAKIAASK